MLKFLAIIGFIQALEATITQGSSLTLTTFSNEASNFQCSSVKYASLNDVVAVNPLLLGYTLDEWNSKYANAAEQNIPWCGQTISISYGGQTKVYTIVDTCSPDVCSYTNDVDFATTSEVEYWSQIVNKRVDNAVINGNIKWSYGGASVTKSKSPVTSPSPSAMSPSPIPSANTNPAPNSITNVNQLSQNSESVKWNRQRHNAHSDGSSDDDSTENTNSNGNFQNASTSENTSQDSQNTSQDRQNPSQDSQSSVSILTPADLGSGANKLGSHFVVLSIFVLLFTLL